MLETDIVQPTVSILQSIVQQVTKASMVRTKNGDVYHTTPPAQPNITGLDSDDAPKELLTDDDQIHN